MTRKRVWSAEAALKQLGAILAADQMELADLLNHRSRHYVEPGAIVFRFEPLSRHELWLVQEAAVYLRGLVSSLMPGYILILDYALKEKQQ